MQQKFRASDKEPQKETLPWSKVENIAACSSRWDSEISHQINKLIMLSLDPFRTFLLKNCLDELLPAITTSINAFLSSTSVPTSLKKAAVTL